MAYSGFPFSNGVIVSRNLSPFLKMPVVLIGGQCPNRTLAARTPFFVSNS